jgi:hypothetical protein
MPIILILIIIIIIAPHLMGPCRPARRAIQPRRLIWEEGGKEKEQKK